MKTFIKVHETGIGGMTCILLDENFVKHIGINKISSIRSEKYRFDNENFPELFQMISSVTQKYFEKKLEKDILIDKQMVENCELIDDEKFDNFLRGIKHEENIF